MTGLLLHGLPGCGKTKFSHAIANDTDLQFYKVSAEVISGVSDDIDAIASKRKNLQWETERRIVTQLLTCMDESQQILRAMDNDFGQEVSEKITYRMFSYVLVIGATSRPDAVDHALRKLGCFDREIVLGVPDVDARAEILSLLTRNIRIDGKFDRFKIARFTSGFVGTDLAKLVSKARNFSKKRIIDKRRPQLGENVDWWRYPWSSEEIENISITMLDFEEATKLVQPFTRRGGVSSISNIKWEDVGSLDSLKNVFNRCIIQRIKHPEDYEELGVDMEVGFMLHGPPGCGKTLIAKALVNEAGANFIHIKHLNKILFVMLIVQNNCLLCIHEMHGLEFLGKYAGESEKEVRAIFSRARTCSPCIIFFDERGCKRGREGASLVERALDQLLIELDGVD
ncbi:hypothetical protein KFK09_018494 [Dendrobium nobile]|uniref:AAA+ ATPase domain-containing protein n=1 Tax=Dendrobium nobile TaxID=94219 RepID=A0A8T3AX52_DENNO|nr:hypothetical protein KFK09_018494 [Dendrobium nobile]